MVTGTGEAPRSVGTGSISPGVLVQVALVSQLSVLAAHSSTSDNYTIKCKIL